MKKLNVLIDMDGVLADTHFELLKRYNSEYNANLKKSDLIHWDLTKIQKAGTHLVKYFDTPGFFASLPVYEGARQGIEALSSIKCVELFIASAPTTVGYVEKEQWIKEYFPEIPVSNIIFTARKDMLAGDIIIDDGLHNIHPTRCSSAILFDQPWNRHGIASNKGVFRAHSWNDVVGIVYYLLQERMAS